MAKMLLVHFLKNYMINLMKIQGKLWSNQCKLLVEQFCKNKISLFIYLKKIH